MDSSFASDLAPGIVGSRLPFEDAVSPDIVASVFRQLWEISDGGNEVDNESCEDDPQLNLSASDIEVEDEIPMIVEL